MKILNDIWEVFASVRLALFTLSSLALTSILGTIVPQGESAAHYADIYGPKVARFITLLDIDDMYHSWWFLFLLGLLCSNLIICSLERIPRVLRIIRSDSSDYTEEKIKGMGRSSNFSIDNGESAESIPGHLRKGGLRVVTKKQPGGTLFFGEKGKWSRMGVYVVHLSILVIFLGGVIGSFTGFKASVMLPELQSTSKVYSYDDSKPIELGFEVRCDSFGIEYYPNTMPKEYKSRLTIRENGKDILTRDIEVNSPLTYKGITFYQSSYQGFRDFIVNVRNSRTGTQKSFTLPFQTKNDWPEEELQFGILNAKALDQRVVSAKLWFKAGEDAAQTLWMDDDTEITLKTSSGDYSVLVKQRYATGLQVSKDPGVGIVYLGCGLMLLGLYMAFFMSHWRVWVFISNDNNMTTISLAGSASKNRPALHRFLARLESSLKDT